jgi:hypothetical protein
LGFNSGLFNIQHIDLILNVIHDGGKAGVDGWMDKGQMIPFLDFMHGIEFYDLFNIESLLLTCYLLRNGTMSDE